MQSSSIAHLKKEIQSIPKNELVTICTKLIKYKRENKELLHYILFESTDEQNFILQLKEEVSNLFTEVNPQTVFFAKKTIRKILRLITKYCKFSEHTPTHIDLLIHFCNEMNGLKLKWINQKIMVNMYENQLKKIYKLVSTLHEDLQFDYQEKINNL